MEHFILYGIHHINKLFQHKECMLYNNVITSLKNKLDAIIWKKKIIGRNNSINEPIIQKLKNKLKVKITKVSEKGNKYKQTGKSKPQNSQSYSLITIIGLKWNGLFHRKTLIAAFATEK